MNRMTWPALALVALGVSPVSAQHAPTKSTNPVDGRFGAVAAALQTVGPASPYFGGHGLGPDARTDGVGASLRFRRPLEPAELDALAAKGVNWTYRDGRMVQAGRVYGAFVEFRALPALESTALLEWAEVAWHPVVLSPLDVTSAEVGGAATRGTARDGATGTGAVIGAIDSGVDVLHPHFFFADGGAFAWIDADRDGRPTPEVDFVDYDLNGVGDFNEVLRVLDGAEVFEREVRDLDGVLDVRRDWIYVDANGDGRRNAGLGAGFTEFDPGYGEPCFVPDDADRDGVLEPDERVLLLRTSKVQRYVTPDRTYRRGEDLIASEAAALAGEPFHGTAVASILVGGQLAHERVGVAPGAELVMYAVHPARGFDDDGQLASIADARASGLDVLVHEWTNPFTAPIDGGGNIEAAMQDARDAGVVQVNPLGNMNLSRKHVEFTANPGEPVTLPFVVGDGFDSRGEVYPYASIWASIHWRLDQVPVFDLALPGGESVTIPLDGTIVRAGAANAQASLSTSPRGTRQMTLTIWSDGTDIPLPPGEWRLAVAAPLGGSFHGRVTDYWSGWSVGVHWRDATRDRGTAVYPATADAALGVAAYGGRNFIEADGTSSDQLRNFSGRGPRIDGARMADIAAPDDPFAAFGVSQAWLDVGTERNWFSTFGGTSGAAPHVAGAAAVIRALAPEAPPDEVETRILAAARRDQYTGAALPDPAWGEGKLDVFAAAFGRSRRATNVAPTGQITRVDVDTFSAADSRDADGDVLTYRWDFDYDGVWDTGWSTEATAVATGLGDAVRLDVRDAEGGIGGAVLVLDDGQSGLDMDEGDVGDGPPIRPPRRERPCGCGAVDEVAGGPWPALVALLVSRRRRRRSVGSSNG